MYEILVRQMGNEAWAWYLKTRAQDGAAPRVIEACSHYYISPDIAWRHAIIALDAAAHLP